MTFSRYINKSVTENVVGVNWSHPLADGLSQAVLPTVIYDRRGSHHATPYDANTSIVGTRSGKAFKTNTTSNAAGLYAPTCPFYLNFSNGQPGMTMVMVAKGTTGGGSAPMFLGDASNGFGYTSTGYPSVRGSSGWLHSTDVPMTLGLPQVITYGWKYNDSGCYVGIDGVLKPRAPMGAGSTLAGDPRLYGHGCLGGYSHGVNEVYLMLIFGKLIPINQAAMISRDPWALLNRAQQPIFSNIPETISIYYPASDVEVTGWTASTGVVLANCLDELTLERSDYITSPNVADPSAQPVVLSLSSPLPAGTWDLSIDIKRLVGLSDYVVELINDSNVVQGFGYLEDSTVNEEVTQILPIVTSGVSTRIRIQFI